MREYINGIKKKLNLYHLYRNNFFLTIIIFSYYYHIVFVFEYQDFYFIIVMLELIKCYDIKIMKDKYKDNRFNINI